MSNEQKVTINLLPNLLGLLGCVLVVLKALGMIELAWVWVLCPFWIGLAIIFGIFLTAFVLFILYLIVVIFCYVVSAIFGTKL